MTNRMQEVKARFVLRHGIFNQEYYSIRYITHEITVDNLVPNSFQVSLCTPYNEKMGSNGGGEVKESWTFDSEEEAYQFINTRRYVI